MIRRELRETPGPPLFEMSDHAGLNWAQTTPGVDKVDPTVWDAIFRVGVGARVGRNESHVRFVLEVKTNGRPGIT